jgi:hypothetical protein
MACDHDKTDLVLWVYDETPAAAREPIRARLQGCADCRHELEELRQAARMLSALPTPETRPTTLRGVETALLAAGGPARRRTLRRTPSWLLPAALAASLILGAALGLAPRLLRPSRVPERGTTVTSVPRTEVLAWMTGLDDRLLAIARQLEAIRDPGLRLDGMDPARAEPWSGRGQELDQRLQRLRAQIARLARTPVWDAGQAEL